MLLHCLSCELDNPKEAYQTIQTELKKYNPALLQKPEAIVLTKTDLVGEKTLKSYIKLFEKMSKTVLTASIIDDASVKDLSGELVKIVRKL